MFCETVCGMHFDRQKTRHPYICPLHDLSERAGSCTLIAPLCNKIDILARGETMHVL